MTADFTKFQALGISDSTTEWMLRECPGMVDTLQDAFNNADAPLNEKQIWNLVARIFSPLWVEKDAALRQAELERSIEYSADNKPLGAIGSALDSDRTNEAETRHLSALAEFTVVDEMLRGHLYLNDLLQSLNRHQAMIAESLGISRVTVAADKVLDAAFNKAAPKSAENILVNALRTAMTRLAKA